MIFIENYLEDESSNDQNEHPCPGTDDSEVLIEFPTDQSEAGCSREELGKWVDKLMALPEQTKATEHLAFPADDPLLVVAERILGEEPS
ncbi:MAG TPA: hypothetical protein DCX67_11230 [Opitutae bacterium]|nr:hypothetical protein [Opitutae bacterium]